MTQIRPDFPPGGDNEGEGGKIKVTEEELKRILRNIRVNTSSLKGKPGDAGWEMKAGKLRTKAQEELRKKYEVVDNPPQSVIENTPTLTPEELKAINEKQVADDLEEAETLKKGLMGDALSSDEVREAIKSEAKVLGRPLTRPEQKIAIEKALSKVVCVN